MSDLTDKQSAQTTKIVGADPSSGIESNFADATSDGRLKTESSGDIASAATDSGNPVKTGGIVNPDGSLFTSGQRANTQMSSAGSQYVDISGRLASYSAYSAFTAAATATDVFTITGSASKTVKIRSIVIDGSNTGNTNVLFILVKRSTANSGGTSSILTNVPRDSLNAAATATVRSYTANPTTGTLVGNIAGDLGFLPQLASSNPTQDIVINFNILGVQPITLRGTSEVLAINLAGTAISGTTILNISINWTEE